MSSQHLAASASTSFLTHVAGPVPALLRDCSRDTGTAARLQPGHWHCCKNAAETLTLLQDCRRDTHTDARLQPGHWPICTATRLQPRHWPCCTASRLQPVTLALLHCCKTTACDTGPAALLQDRSLQLWPSLLPPTALAMLHLRSSRQWWLKQTPLQ